MKFYGMVEHNPGTTGLDFKVKKSFFSGITQFKIDVESCHKISLAYSNRQIFPNTV